MPGGRRSGEVRVTQRAQARVGAVLRQKWRLDSLLGVGGMAAVYAATHRNGKRGAVKMLHLELSTDGEARKRFLREGYVANAVAHPGAVSVLDDDMADDGSVFLVMELLEGQNIDARAEAQPGDEASRRAWCWRSRTSSSTSSPPRTEGHRPPRHQAGEPVPDQRTGQVKVLDFGLARLHDLSRGPNEERLTADRRRHGHARPSCRPSRR